ncbi:hypothetical protein ACEQPO_00725 [Bacillus sp. SL00103]
MEQFVSRGLDTEEAFRQTLLQLKGSYAIALFDNGKNKETIYVAKNKSPLLVGFEKICNVVASGRKWRCFK